MTKMLHFSKELSFPLEAVTQKFDFLGQSGGGKTYGAMKLAELMLAVEAQVVILDIPGVWPGLRSSADGKSPGFKVLLVGGEDCDLPINVSSGRLIADMVVDTGLSVIINMSELLVDEMLIFVTDFLSRLFDRKKRSRDPMHLFIEECQEIIPEMIDNKLQVKCRAVAIRVMKIGRNYGIGWSAITQEPQAASKRAINLAGTIVAVRTVGFHERQALERWARSKAKSKDQLALMDILPELKIGEALVWSPGWLGHAGVVHVLPKVTFDSSKTPEVGKKRAQARVVADIDIEKLKQDMADLVQKAEAEDPKLLQKKLSAAMADNVRLRSEIVKREAAPPAAGKTETKTKEVAVALKKDAVAFHSGIARLELWHTNLLKAHEMLAASMAPLIERWKAIESALGRAAVVESPTTSTVTAAYVPLLLSEKPHTQKAKTYTTQAQVDADFGKSRFKVFPDQKSDSPIVKVVPVEGGVSAGGRKMLEALALRPSHRLTRAQLGTLSGFSTSGGTFRTYLPRLRVQGLVEYSGDDVVLTPAGKSMVGDAIRSAPQTTEQLHEVWKNSLDSGPRKMFEILLQAFPDAITREQLGEASGFARGGGTFRTYLPRLHKLGLVEYSGEQVRASETLFMEAGRG